jgi:hypothetical protein
MSAFIAHGGPRRVVPGFSITEKGADRPVLRLFAHYLRYLLTPLSAVAFKLAAN